MSHYLPGGPLSSLKIWLIEQKVNIAAFGLFLLLTVVAAWPVISNLNEVIIGIDNDVYINPWADWWTGKALSDPEISLWETEYLFYPNGANLIYHSFSPLNSMVSLGLGLILSPLAAYNLTILINYVLIGFSMFQFARYMTDSTIAAILAGIVFAFNSQITYQSAHPVLFTVWSLPWTSLFFVKAVRENSYRYAALAAVVVFFAAATSVLMIILIGIWLLLLTAYMFFSAEFPRPTLKILLLFGLFSFVFVLPIVFPLFQDAIVNQNSSFVIAPEESISTEIVSILIPDWAREFIRSMYLGIVPFYLFLVATRVLKRDGKLWVLLVTISYLTAIGPIPEFLGKELDVILPWSLIVTPLLRNTYRMMILFAFGWAMIIAIGWLAFRDLLNMSGKNIQIAALVVGLLIYGEYTIRPFPSTPAIVSDFYNDYLDDVPDDVALAILPIGRQDDKRYLFYQTIHQHPITGGVISRAEADTFDFMVNNPVLRAGMVDLDPVPIPDNFEESFQQLAEINVGYLIIDKTLIRNLRSWQQAIPFDPIYEDDLLLVYETNR